MSTELTDDAQQDVATGPDEPGPRRDAPATRPDVPRRGRGGSAVRAAARSAVARRRLQTLIVGVVVLLSAATAVLGVGLLVASHGPFDDAFADTQGSHATAVIRADTPADQVAATGKATGIAAAAGPFDQVTAPIEGIFGPRGMKSVIAGRSEQNGPVDRLTLSTGTWLSGPGQIVLTRRTSGPRTTVGSEVTINGVKLRIVGVAASVTGTADAWVWPTQRDVLDGEDTARQMLYRFASPGVDDTALRAALATVTATLPEGAVTGVTTYLTVRQALNRSISAIAPFVVAFAVLGIVLSVLITVNVVNGAVVSGFRTIGILKTLGFTPGQVVAVYLAQVLAPAVVGALLGVALGAGLAVPLLTETDDAYGLPGDGAGVPLWVVGLVLLAAPLLVALAAIGPATRAGRLPANQAISVGRAPRTGRGFRARRALTASPLPRPIALGLGMPLARPSRAVATLVALLLGAVTLVFSSGLSASMTEVNTAFTRTDAVTVEAQVMIKGAFGPVMARPGGGPIDPPDPADVAAAAAAMPGTAHSTLLREGEIRVAGIGQEVSLNGYTGDASWNGYRLASGRWYSGADEVVVSSYFLRQTGYTVGDRLTMPGGRVVTIAGEVIDGSDRYTVIGDASLVTEPMMARVEIALTPGTDPGAYAQALQAKFPEQSSGVYIEDRTVSEDGETILVIQGLIATLTLLLGVVAALGVLNTVVLTTRERIHEIGVLKSLGMTPRQTRIMVVTSMVGLGLVAGVIAVPLGIALHHAVIPIMGEAASTALPQSAMDVYQLDELLLLGGAGIALAVLGALLPAGWAARTRVATALRAE
ncbi:FtsX-like permease family protein [Catellatospora sichuanensis]|uniref:FtsX-like permease family protein n=1 Tax=Catellatospora sichuanensis TaxID=1969805 RepID=UPI0011821041|nr:FtsX-like permease family protein [Catellatospora sichuanensis]